MWAEIASFVRQRKLSITADTYTHVLGDGGEINLDALVRAHAVLSPVRSSTLERPLSRGFRVQAGPSLGRTVA